MLLSGFTFIRNAIKYDFPIMECIESMLPLVDELVINVGKSEDGTEEKISDLQRQYPKIKIMHSIWDDSQTQDGSVLSQQTNIALEECKSRWALYLQADEALHESEHSLIRRAVEEEDEKWNRNNGTLVDALSFRYLHFYAGYTLIQRPWNWYPSEIRIIRRASQARSFGDAQTFRGEAGKLLQSRLLNAHIYHYGHARKPEIMARKIHYFHRFWHGDGHEIEVKQAYQIRPRDLVWFWGAHPAPYRARVEEGQKWSIQPQTLIQPIPEKVIIFAEGEKQMQLARRLQLKLEQDGKMKVEICNGIFRWIKMVFRHLFSRNKAAFIDLDAETRSNLLFYCWIWDAFSIFYWRVAHAPQGKLSRFRARFYNAVNWGTHEKTELGFVVPDKEQVRQLARWVGVED